MPVRLGKEAIAAAKKAAALKGKSLTDYATAVLLAAANRDIDAFVREQTSKAKKQPKDGGESK
jgi:hypothetical protein